MSLEEVIKANTAAITGLNAAIDAQVALLKSLGKAGSAAAPAAGKATPAKPAKLTVETFTDRFAKWLGDKSDVDGRKARGAKLKEMLTHYGVAKIGELPEDKWKEALGFLATLEAGDDPDYGNGDDDGDSLV